MKIVVDENSKNQRLDIFCTEKFQLQRSKVQKYIALANIKVNELASRASYKIKTGDVIELQIEEETPVEIKPKNIPLDILYEDDDLIVLNKQKGLICHPTSRMEEDTLVSALMYHTKNLSDIQGKTRMGIVHRLDCNTSGLMLAAKTNSAHKFLQKDIQTKKTVRKYLAVCHGMISENEGIINKPLVHYLGKTVKMNVSKEGLEAETHFRVLERFNSSTFIELELKTGRTHQIRCHLASLGHPLVGDDLYGAKGYQNGVFRNFKTEGQVLMSYYLSFTHPTTGEIMEFEIKEENYHPDLIKTLSLLRSSK